VGGQSDGATWGGSGGPPVARLPSSGSFTLPTTGTFLIEVSSLSANATGHYQVTLGSPATRFPANGRVTLGNGGPGLANVSMTFTRVTGSRAPPGPVITDASRLCAQTRLATGPP